MTMLRASMAVLTAVVLARATLDSQQPARPMSPQGSTQTQVLGKWTKGELRLHARQRCGAHPDEGRDPAVCGRTTHLGLPRYDQ
jgi:hypothetical protein